LLSESKLTTRNSQYIANNDAYVNNNEPLLDDGSQLLDLSSLLANDLVGLGGSDDDLHLLGGRSDLNTGITVIGQTAQEEL
jgi:hypothetical protein